MVKKNITKIAPALKGKKLAISLGEKCALSFYTLFKDPNMRGDKFIWPDTLYYIVKVVIKIECRTYNVSKYCTIAEDAGLKKLKSLLDK
jgi:hypothetical protein